MFKLDRQKLGVCLEKLAEMRKQADGPPNPPNPPSQPGAPNPPNIIRLADLQVPPPNHNTLGGWAGPLHLATDVAAAHGVERGLEYAGTGATHLGARIPFTNIGVGRTFGRIRPGALPFTTSAGLASLRAPVQGGVARSLFRGALNAPVMGRLLGGTVRATGGATGALINPVLEGIDIARNGFGDLNTHRREYEPDGTVFGYPEPIPGLSYIGGATNAWMNPARSTATTAVNLRDIFGGNNVMESWGQRGNTADRLDAAINSNLSRRIRDMGTRVHIGGEEALTPGELIDYRNWIMRRNRR